MNRNNRKRVAIVPVLLTILFIFAGVALAEEGCVTEKCHSSIKSGAVVHAAAETCDSCHQPVTQPHPQQSVKTFKLTQEPPALCETCHTPFGKKKHVHTAVKNGMCTSCHNPHASAQPKLLVQPATQLCGSCHADKTSFKYMHGPAAAGDCMMCHNPHESDNPAQTVKSGVNLCFQCHVDMQKEIQKAHVHPAMEGGCISCHNPHGSAFRKFFAAEGNNLCYQCHPDKQELISKAADVHPPVKSERGCPSCHSPHASDAPKLLPKQGKDLCLICHAGVIKKEYTVLHGPIKQGACTPCHDPHASPNAKLLVKEFPVGEVYVAYSDNEYVLCFSCHNRDSMRHSQTSSATGFRDGERNLHYLHVNNKEKSRSCVICHNMHGGTLPRLITSDSLFGKWKLPIKFVKTETGGSCSPGCHRKVTYDRRIEGKESAPGKK